MARLAAVEVPQGQEDFMNIKIQTLPTPKPLEISQLNVDSVVSKEEKRSRSRAKKFEKSKKSLKLRQA